ncbi:MAG: hypothetical protein R3286_05875 [Gammaproteobacteria bacterium]|nr:hypothetical protein [Gammaproteobacteria bacterium]
MKKVLLALILMPAIAYGSVKGYAWYKVTSAMDEIVVAMTPFANVTYGGVGTSLAGSVSVHDLRIYSPAMQLDMSIEEVRVSAPNLQTLLNIEDELRSQKVPEELGLHLVHARMPTSAVANMQAMSVRSEFDEYFASLATLGCGDVKRIDAAELIEMGYHQLDMSMSIKVRRNAVSNYMDMRMEAEWHDGGRYFVDAQIPGDGSLNNLMASGNTPRFSFDIENAAYNERLVTYCAEKSGQDADGFVATHVDLLKSHLEAAGVSLNEELYDAYRDYLAGGDNITISINPDDPTLLQHIGMYQPTDMLTILGVEMSVAGRPVTYEVDWNQRKFEAALAGELPAPSASDDEQQANAASPAPAEPEPHKRAYVDVDKAELANFAESSVRLKTVTGRLIEGRLKGVEKDTVWLHVRVRGGAATLPILLGDISSAKVYM